MAGISWQDSLSGAQQAELYALYVLLFNSSFALANKQAAFESAADGPHSWPITKVTISALKYIAENGNADLLRRAHAVRRADRARNMFERDQPMTQSGLLEYFFGLDPVTLAVAKTEAGPDGDSHFSKQLEVPVNLFTKSGKGTTIYEPEFKWATGTLKDHSIPFKQFTGRVRKQRVSKAPPLKPLESLAENTDEPPS